MTSLDRDQLEQLAAALDPPHQNQRTTAAAEWSVCAAENCHWPIRPGMTITRWRGSGGWRHLDCAAAARLENR